MAQMGCAHRNIRPMPRIRRRFICFGEGPGLDNPSTILNYATAAELQFRLTADSGLCTVLEAGYLRSPVALDAHAGRQKAG